MKKIFLFCAVAASLLFSSCDMDLSPVGSIAEDESVESTQDCSRFRAGFYGNFRALTTSSALIFPELQCDNFQALAPLYGNQAGDIFKGTFTSATGEFASVWASLYSVIGNVNFFIPRAEALVENNENLSADDVTDINLYIGEAYFFRAYYYAKLFDLFCQTYSDAKKDQPALGVPLVTEYAPTADRSKYVGRSTMAETFKLIYSDLDKAEAALKAYELVDRSNLVPGAPYINSWVITAFRARLALLQGNKADAVKYAQEVIESGLYELAGVNDYASVWVNDDPVKEVIMMPFVNAAEAAGCNKYGAAYWTKVDSPSAWYIPGNNALSMYAARDCRGDVFFEDKDLQISGEDVSTPCFVKWPGNPEYDATSSTRGVNASKPFRISEMYLIIAECADEATANQALTDIRKARIRMFRPGAALSGDELVQAVREERNKELIGEGFRLSDLRRWGIGFTRDNETPTPNYPVANFNTLYYVAGAQSLSYKAGDYRMVWPIPSDEIQANPQIKGQQNPGY